jgi:hypothetical protein
MTDSTSEVQSAVDAAATALGKRPDMAELAARLVELMVLFESEEHREAGVLGVVEEFASELERSGADHVPEHLRGHRQNLFFWVVATRILQDAASDNSQELPIVADLRNIGSEALMTVDDKTEQDRSQQPAAVRASAHLTLQRMAHNIASVEHPAFEEIQSRTKQAAVEILEVPHRVNAGVSLEGVFKNKIGKLADLLSAFPDARLPSIFADAPEGQVWKGLAVAMLRDALTMADPNGLEGPSSALARFVDNRLDASVANIADAIVTPETAKTTER